MIVLLFAWLAIAPPSEQHIRQLLTARSGIVHLPGGRIDVHSELALPDGAHDLTILGSHTTLHATADFHGRAVLTCRHCRNLTIRDLTIDGNRAALEKPLAIPQWDEPFFRAFPNNGILLEDGFHLHVEQVDFTNVANFAILVSHSAGVGIEHVSVTASGSRNAAGRNNTSGGILIEQGSSDFTVADSVFRDIRGNAVWTHACFRTPRNLRGQILRNDISDVGRDAIQVGHSSEVRVAGNTGHRIGMRLDEVDLEGGGTPVAIDTAGNVDRTTYEDNRFEEVNGKCIDLDGFHDGTVRGNTCINRGKLQDYVYGNFGISLNNTSKEMRSQDILIENNTLEGMKFGGIFVIGTGHRILHNRMSRLNIAHCNDSQGQVGCLILAGEPGFLESGIYLARRAERPDPAHDITIEDNTISGWKMARYCIRAAPGVSLADNKIQGNHCSDE